MRCRSCFSRSGGSGSAAESVYGLGSRGCLEQPYRGYIGNNGKENGNYHVIIGYIFGLYRGYVGNNGKENGSHMNYRDFKEDVANAILFLSPASCALCSPDPPSNTPFSDPHQSLSFHFFLFHYPHITPIIPIVSIFFSIILRYGPSSRLGSACC